MSHGEAPSRSRHGQLVGCGESMTWSAPFEGALKPEVPWLSSVARSLSRPRRRARLGDCSPEAHQWCPIDVDGDRPASLRGVPSARQPGTRVGWQLDRRVLRLSPSTMRSRSDLFIARMLCPPGSEVHPRVRRPRARARERPESVAGSPAMVRPAWLTLASLLPAQVGARRADGRGTGGRP